MSYAYANKDQMKLWKSATKPDKDGPDLTTTKVQFKIKKLETGYRAYLIATDGYQGIKREIECDDEAKVLKIGIPREAIEQAEKAMKAKSHDRAYFTDGKITVREMVIDEDGVLTGESKIKAIIPYSEQMELLADFDNAIQKAVNSEQPGRIVTLDANLLRKIADQLKSGDARVLVDLHVREGLDGFVLRCFDGVEGEEITAVIMPVKA